MEQQRNSSLKWLCFTCALMFVAISMFMRVIEVFPSGNDGAYMALLAIASAVMTIGLGIASLPSWQSYFGFAVFIYAIYWFFFAMSYAVS
jgi:hypothetical protein